MGAAGKRMPPTYTKFAEFGHPPLPNAASYLTAKLQLLSYTCIWPFFWCYRLGVKNMGCVTLSQNHLPVLKKEALAERLMGGISII